MRLTALLTAPNGAAGMLAYGLLQGSNEASPTLGCIRPGLEAAADPHRDTP